MPQPPFPEVPSTGRRSTPFGCSAWVLTLLAFLGMALTARPQGGVCWQEERATASVVTAETLRSVHLQPALGRALSCSLLQVWCQVLREKVLLSHCALRAVAPLPRQEEVCICTEREPGISIFGIAAEVS